ncbi:MAG TPA: VOC family protein [Flavobacteriales bacterium]|nr:VOC family protein [Flavobacteriales bacterium]
MRTPILLLLAVAATAFAAGRISAPDAPPDVPRATGIGGIFFKSKDPQALKAWYTQHLGMPMNEYGAVFEFGDADADGRGYLQWSAFGMRTKYFAPSPKEFMINYRVVHLEQLVKDMRANGVVFTDSIERYEYGAFVHALDPDSNKLELWEPIDTVFTRLYKGTTVK